jgi:hypothetical protein
MERDEQGRWSIIGSSLWPEDSQGEDR